jgi:hypothetical protein
MNGVQATGALPATTVLRLTNARPMKGMDDCRASDVVLAAVTHPPRIGETRPIAALMPQVLARYGLVEESSAEKITVEKAIDLLA